ncbi:hypothetical protein VTJ49DRAFT_2237 [Mycothermus thermophilus]|uniref:Peptidase C51 domain-containing protein n=1 Tax=Humicola insolens TaxID=85995 RepID=A0ABR3VAG5_HUMIN
MKFLAIAAFIGTVAVPLASAYPVEDEFVDCYSGPDTTYDVEEVYPAGDEINVTCQIAGESVDSAETWFKTQDGCYVQDVYVHTGNETITPAICSSDDDSSDSNNSTITARAIVGRADVGSPIKDDYPSAYKSQCGGVDPWRYYKCQCVSFAAFRINKRLNIKFTNSYKGQAWGNAKTWYNAAKKAGVKANNTPKPGAIAWTDKGSAGHVAWVAKVSGDKVTVEEYNWNNPKRYGKRTVAKSSFKKYIHLK